MEPHECRVMTLREPLRTLTPDHICQIDRYLKELTAYGHVALIKRDGRLRYIERTESMESVPVGREHRSRRQIVCSVRTTVRSRAAANR